MAHRASCRDLSFGLDFLGQGVWEVGLGALSMCLPGEGGCGLQRTPSLSLTGVFCLSAGVMPVQHDRSLCQNGPFLHKDWVHEAPLLGH